MISLGGRHLAAQGYLFRVTTMTSHCTLSKSNGQPDLCPSHSLLLPFASNEICLLRLESTAFLDCVFISLIHFSPWINQLPSVSLGVLTGVSKIGAVLTVLSILSIVARITCVEQDQEQSTLAACVNQKKAPLWKYAAIWSDVATGTGQIAAPGTPQSGTTRTAAHLVSVDAEEVCRLQSAVIRRCCRASRREQDHGGSRLFAGSAMTAV